MLPNKHLRNTHENIACVILDSAVVARRRVAVVAVVSHGAPRVTQVAVAVALLELTLGVSPSGAARVRLRVE